MYLGYTACDVLTPQVHGFVSVSFPSVSWLICPLLYQCCLLLITVILCDTFIFGSFTFFLLWGDIWTFFLDIYPWTFGYLSLDFWIFVLGFLPFYGNLELIYETGITMTKTTTKPVGGLLGLLSIYRSVEKELSLFFILSSPIHERCITIHRFVFYPCIWGKLSTFVNGSYSFSVCS